LQCCNVARISVARDAARPKNSHLVGPPRGAETRPNLRVPVFGANFGLFGPPTAQGVVFRCVAWRLSNLPRAWRSCFWLRVSPQPAAPRRGGLLLLLLRQQLLGRRRSGAGSSSRRYGSAMAPCSLPARAIPCVWRRGAAQRAPRARCAAAFCAAHPRCHDWRAGEEVRWAELWYWSTGGILPPQLCLTMLAECLRGPMNDRLRARPLRPPRQVHRRRSLRAHHVR
jgi:hypothetical protein